MQETVFDKAKQLYTWRYHPIEFYKLVAPSMAQIPSLRPNLNHEQFLNDMADMRISRGLLSAARSTGKTLCMAVLTLWSTYVLPYFLRVPYKVSILSGSLEQSKVLYDYISRGIRGHQFLLDAVEGGKDAINKTFVPFKVGGWIKANPASERTVLSQHCDLLIVDEAGHEGLSDGELIRGSAPLVSPSPYPRILLGSTPYDFMSYFVELWDDPAKYPEYRRYGYWKASECSWISPSEIALAKRTLSEDQFAIQWLGKPTPISGTWINHADLKACIDIQPDRPMRGDGLVIWGVDYGYRDPTVLVILEMLEDKTAIVLEVREWQEDKFEKIQNDLDLISNTYPPNVIYADRSHIGENQRLREKGFPVKEVVFRNDKALLQNNLRAYFQQRRVRLWNGFVPLVQQLIKYTEKTVKNEDYVDAFMMALKKGTQGQGTPWFFGSTTSLARNYLKGEIPSTGRIPSPFDDDDDWGPAGATSE